MLNLTYYWRFYSFGREQYTECMNKLFSNNLLSLQQTTKIVAITAAVFSLFPVIYKKNFIEMGIYLLVALISFLINLYSNYLLQQINVKNRTIYILITLFFTNIILFGIYLDIWSGANSLASLFPCFLICALLMFVNPARFILSLTLSAMVVFITSAVIFIPPSSLGFYIINSIIACLMSLYFSWQITKLRLGLEISTTMLEDEKNKYLDQSTVDELTQLKNRRDFMNTFQRHLTNYRTSDNWLCIALADIDFFKLYNDNYGHPQGDVCLRSIGAALNRLRDELGIYSARVGGEEFAVLWFEKDAANVDVVINKWMDIISELKLLHEKSKVSDYVTMSIGVYVSKCGAYNETQTLYDLADKALYAAKGTGRNCAVINGDEIKQYKITPSNQ